MSKTYKTESIAKTQATKLTKKTGEIHLAFQLNGEWAAMTAEAFQALCAPKAAPAASRKTNVPGRASGGAWIKQALAVLEGKVSKVNAQIVFDGKKHWITNGVTNLFWFHKAERAQAVVAALA